MTRTAVALALTMALLPHLAAGQPTVSPPVAALVDANHDQILNRAFVPSPDRRVGEVRLIRRGDANVVQTLLYTKILRRVVGEIRQKELGNWPEGRDGHADAMRYSDALEAAQQQIWERFPKFERRTDTRQKLLIEFVLSATDAVVMLSEYDMSENHNEVQITSRRPIATLTLARAYVRRNMRLIAADSFSVPEDQVDTLLSALPLLADETPPRPTGTNTAAPTRKE